MAEPTGASARRMSDVEALMWTLEKDPFLSSTFANVTVLDRPPDLGRLRERLATAVSAVPRLRWRVSPGFGRLAPPMWQDDPNFDIEYHVRRIALPAPGTDRDLFDFAVTFAQDPFDRTRPLWEFTVVEGLERGRAALVQKMHHTITDGEGGVRMSAQFLDLSPDAEGPMRPVDVSGAADEPPPNLLATAVESLTHNVRRQLGVARRAAEGAAGLLAHPDRIPGVGLDAVEGARSLLRQAAVTDHAHSTLWTERSLKRHFEVLRVPLDDAKRAAKSLGGSVNDLFVTAAAGGAAAYHRDRGADVDELRISMPVSTRTDHSSSGNSFTPTRVLVPAAIEDPAERFSAIQERLAATRHERAIGMAGSLAGVLNLLPTSALIRFARQQVETVDFATSNVRGAPFELYVAGAKLEANYPMGPTGGTAWNITLLSYAGSLDMGLQVDTGAVPDPGALRSNIEESFAELLAAGG